MVELKNYIKILGFNNTKDNLWQTATDYKISIEFNENEPTKSFINYGNDIIVHNKGIANFKKAENLVVLEAVLRLVKKGYKPKFIELEKSWPSGHGTSGRLDILVRDNTKKTFAMIECKTWGEEYVKERANTIESGGQLFSYGIQEATTKLLILYTSRININKIEYLAEGIATDILTGNNSEELHKTWNKSFINESIFGEEATPYLTYKRNLKKSDLKELDAETGQGLFNEFAEILRRYAISDKSNAFNKIFNLFVCKIYDEDTKNHKDELDFQWKINDDFNKLIERLSSLYIKGVKDFLQIQIDENYFSEFQEFAFIDIYNSDTFDKNFRIVKEVVEFLQNYQIKYTSKHQFLGDFFEDLLNSGVKQEAGQFFTPTPLARFLLKSLPIEQIITEKINSKEQNIIPYVIDYACGAGHFLTEAIDEIEQHIDNVDISKLVGRSQKHFLSIKENFFWAKDYIYGVEKDYRLAKTTKVAMFLYGDGDAIIVNGDGLDDFQNSLTFQGMLKTTKKEKELNKFDIVVSNPPFSISGFKQVLNNGKFNYNLYKFISNKSTEIECFFIERCYQLLKPNGCAGIILPLSILNNENRIYIESRKLLLLNFEIIGMVELRDKTFKPTNTTTISLFLRKRSESELSNAIDDGLKLVKNKKLEILDTLSEKYNDLDFSCENIKTQLNAVIANKENITGIGLSIEIVLFLAFILNKDKNVLLGYSGEKKEQENFLGYRFSKSRGREGLEILESQHLFNPNKYHDPEKVNSHILSNFHGIKLDIPANLEKHIKYINYIELLEKDNIVINNPSQYFESDNYVIATNSPLGDFIDGYSQVNINLGTLIEKKELEYISGLVYNKQTEVPYKTTKKVITASNLDLNTGKLIFTDKIIYLNENFELPIYLIPRENDIIISNSSGSLKHLGKVAYVDKNYEDCVIGGFLSIIRCNNVELSKAIFYRLLSLKFRKYISTLRGQNINNLDFDKLKSFKFEIPKDLNEFNKFAIGKEKELSDVMEKVSALKKIL